MRRSHSWFLIDPGGLSAEVLFKEGVSPVALEVIISLFRNGIMPNR